MRLVTLYILILHFSLAAALKSAVAQTASYVPLYSAGTAQGDTLLNQDTGYIYLATNNKYFYELSCIVAITQLTGTAAGTIYYEVGNPPADGTSNTAMFWVQGTTSQTITGSGTTYYYFTDSLVERRARFKIITPSGSRTLKVQLQGILKKRD